MAISYPSSLDSFPNPQSTDLLENASPTLDHWTQHANINDAVEALEAKVGVDSSVVTTSHDYKLSEVTGSDKAVSKTATQTLTNKTLTSPVINVGSDATGDMYYRNASGAFTRLPAGTDTQIIIYQSGVPTVQNNPAGSDASTTVKGVVEEATSTELSAGTAVGGTGARLFINPSTLMPNGDIEYSYLRGIFFGDGSDGNVTISSNTSLSRDMYYNDLTINTGVTLNPSGYRIFVKGTLTTVGTGKIARDGNNGTNGSGAAAGTGGSALSAGTIAGGVAGGNGGYNGNVGTNGGSVTNAIGTTTNSGNGGAGSSGVFAGGTGGTTTVASPTIITPKFPIQLSAINLVNFVGLFNNTGSGGGGGSSTNNGGYRGGGGGGSAGGIVAIYANNIVFSATNSVSVIGGNGGNGGTSGLGDGGGGGGGNGGTIVLVYKSVSGTTLTTSSACAGGSAGTGASNGNAGADGTIYSYQI